MFKYSCAYFCACIFTIINQEAVVWRDGSMEGWYYEEMVVWRDGSMEGW